MKGPTQERLKELLNYDPETGVFTWKVRRGLAEAGPAGSTKKDGYNYICIDGRTMLAHRLAWFYVHGQWPRHVIDHINGDRTDNRIVNLRDVPYRTNNENQKKPHRSNTSGYLGVSRIQSRGKWQASIQLNGRNKNLGRYDTPEEAHAVYLEAKRQLHEGCTI